MGAAVTVPTGTTNRRHGRNRQLLLDALEQAQRPMGAYELLRHLREDGVRSPLQIYRALAQLVEDGAVHKIESLSAFALCTHADCNHDSHATFAICRACGRTRELHHPELNRLLRKIARQEGFCTTSTTVELSGLCGSCAHA